MMIARTQRVKQWLPLALGLMSATAFGQGYSNPHYQGARPKKGDPVTMPTYSSPASQNDTTSAPAPSYNENYNSGYSPAATNHVAGSTSHSMEIAASFRYPVGMGDAGASLKPKFGGEVQLYLQPLMDPAFKNFVSIGYDSFSLKGDADSKLNLIPFTAGLEIAPEPNKTLRPVFGLALGGAYAWIGVPNSQVVTGKAYFLAQVRPGFEFNRDNFAIVFQAPVSFLIGSTKMSYVAYSVGVRFGI